MLLFAEQLADAAQDVAHLVQLDLGPDTLDELVDLLIGQVNIDDEPLLAHQEQIEVIPTFVLYKNGQAVASTVAPESKAAIESFIREGLK